MLQCKNLPSISTKENVPVPVFLIGKSGQNICTSTMLKLTKLWEKSNKFLQGERCSAAMQEFSKYQYKGKCTGVSKKQKQRKSLVLGKPSRKKTQKKFGIFQTRGGGGLGQFQTFFLIFLGFF